MFSLPVFISGPLLGRSTFRAVHWLTFISPISVQITALKILFACEAFCWELSNISSVDHFMNIWSWNPYIHQSRDITRNIFCVSLTWLTYFSTSKPNVNKVYNKIIWCILCYLILCVRSKVDIPNWPKCTVLQVNGLAKVDGVEQKTVPS